ncbi:MAG: hypothetical protein KAI72_07450 [Candidatus Pacebacteria bacterium]|nr:hypothetical protein [Candidatus Paceibacterota bacterium]
MYKIILKTIIFLGLVSPATTFAGVVDVVISPEIAKPNQTISASLSGTLIDFNSSDIYWYLDNEIQKHGIGEKSFSFMSGEVDEKTVLDVIIMIPDGRRIDLQKIIEPMEVDLIWEADTYTPPFYRGKAMPTYKSPIKVVAIPGGKNSKTKFIYNWSIDNLNNIVGASGYNQSTFTTFGSYAGYNRKINVTMFSFDKSKKMKKTIQVTSIEPELVLYENNSLMGIIFNSSLNNTKDITKNEFSVKAEPYFITRGEMKNVQYEWAIDNNRIGDENRQDKVVTFIRPDGSGKADLEAYIKNTNNFYQEAGAEVTLSY